MNRADFVKSIGEDGYFIVKDILDPEYIKAAKPKLMSAIESERKKFGAIANYRDYCMVLLCSLYGKEFIDLFDNEKLIQPFEWILGSGCIVYAYTSSSMPPGSSNFSRRIHVDCPRLIPDYVTNMGATILLDDFTLENGATSFLPGSHVRIEQPTVEEYATNCKRVVAPAGSVFYFNARLWHSGELNSTNSWRHALTINMCRSFMKQRIDIPRAMKDIPTSSMSERAQQKLGFLSIPPSSIEEYYKPFQERTYKQAPE